MKGRMRITATLDTDIVTDDYPSDVDTIEKIIDFENSENLEWWQDEIGSNKNTIFKVERLELEGEQDPNGSEPIVAEEPEILNQED